MKIPNTEKKKKTQKALLKERIKGKLPVIDILGHTFYVDLRMGVLRAKDDFINAGIRFDDLDNWYIEKENKVWICYNPKTHSHEEPDFTKITEIPKGLHILEIPAPRQMDPVGYARLEGWNLDEILKETPILDKMVAKVIPWEETYFFKMIKENRLNAKQVERKRPLQKRSISSDNAADNRKGKRK